MLELYFTHSFTEEGDRHMDLAEQKRLRQRRSYTTMRIEKLKIELTDLTAARASVGERLRTDKDLERTQKADLLSQYLYASERYKDARAEIQDLAAERAEVGALLAGASAAS